MCPTSAGVTIVHTLGSDDEALVAPHHPQRRRGARRRRIKRVHARHELYRRQLNARPAQLPLHQEQQREAVELPEEQRSGKQATETNDHAMAQKRNAKKESKRSSGYNITLF